MLPKSYLQREIGKICQGARVRSGMTQKQFLDAVDNVILQSTVSDFENGNNSNIYIFYLYLITFPILADSLGGLTEWLKGAEAYYGKTDEI
jgi:transcriptional regulator with XRE-family HTH domain